MTHLDAGSLNPATLGLAWPGVDALNAHAVNGSGILRTADGLRLVNPVQVGVSATPGYTNAQVDDYAGLPRRDFLHRPPLRLTVVARCSHAAPDLTGTAGFGFWNDPFLMTGPRVPAPPRAAWFFFASLPSDLALVEGVPGWGWKAAVVDALHPRGLLALPLTLPAAPLMRRPHLRRRLWPWFTRSFRAAEALLPTPLDEPHAYMLEWRRDRARFYVDGATVLDAPAPQGPLGLVVWLDNQFLVVRPTGHVGYGVVPKPTPQWLQIHHLHLERLPA